MRHSLGKSFVTLVGIASTAALACGLVGCKFTDDIDKLVVADVAPSVVKDGTFLEFLQTHLSSKNRVEQFKVWMPEAEGYFRASGKKPACIRPAS